MTEEERKELQELMRELMVLNADLNEHDEKLARIRNEYFELPF